MLIKQLFCSAESVSQQGHTATHLPSLSKYDLQEPKQQKSQEEREYSCFVNLVIPILIFH